MSWMLKIGINLWEYRLYSFFFSRNINDGECKNDEANRHQSNEKCSEHDTGRSVRLNNRNERNVSIDVIDAESKPTRLDYDGIVTDNYTNTRPPTKYGKHVQFNRVHSISNEKSIRDAKISILLFLMGIMLCFLLIYYIKFLSWSKQTKFTSLFFWTIAIYTLLPCGFYIFLRYTFWIRQLDMTSKYCKIDCNANNGLYQFMKCEQYPTSFRNRCYLKQL